MENENNNVNEVVETTANNEEVKELSTEEKKKAINLQDLIYVKKYIDDKNKEEATARDAAIEGAVHTATTSLSNMIDTEKQERENAVAAEAAARKAAIESAVHKNVVDGLKLSDIIAKGSNGKWAFTDLANTDFTFKESAILNSYTENSLPNKSNGLWYGATNMKRWYDNTNVKYIVAIIGNTQTLGYQTSQIYEVSVIPDAELGIDALCLNKVDDTLARAIEQNKKELYVNTIHILGWLDNGICINCSAQVFTTKKYEFANINASTIARFIKEISGSNSIPATGSIIKISEYSSPITSINAVFPDNGGIPYLTINGLINNTGVDFNYSVNVSDNKYIVNIFTMGPIGYLL